MFIPHRVGYSIFANRGEGGGGHFHVFADEVWAHIGILGVCLIIHISTSGVLFI